MATSDKATSYDVMPDERKAIVASLQLALTSQLRAARAATSSVVADAYKAEAAKLEALIAKFR